MKILLKEDSNWIGISYVPVEDKYFFHTEIIDWSFSKYKKYLLIFADILNYLKSLGIKEVYSLARTEKRKKFNLLFGFKELGIVKTDDGISFYLMRIEC